MFWITEQIWAHGKGTEAESSQLKFHLLTELLILQIFTTKTCSAKYAFL